MNSEKQRLDDETFAALLAGESAETGVASDEADELRAALRSYRTETLQWAERRSATQPSLQPAARRERIWAAVPQWSLAAVAVVSIAAGVAHVYDRSGAGGEEMAVAPVAAVAAPAIAAPTPADIAADNRLLSSIDQAISYSSISVDGSGPKPARSSRTAAPGVMD